MHGFNHEETSDEPKWMVILQKISPVLFKRADALKEENEGLFQDKGEQRGVRPECNAWFGTFFPCKRYYWDN